MQLIKGVATSGHTFLLDEMYHGRKINRIAEVAYKDHNDNTTYEGYQVWSGGSPIVWVPYHAVQYIIYGRKVLDENS